jgi:hypothetical protein
VEFQRDERVERRRARRRQVRRRRLAALLVVSGVAVLVAVSTTSLLGPSKASKAESTPAATIELPRGGTTILPGHKVVAFYGYPGGDHLGVLGSGSPTAVAERLSDQALDYESLERQVLPAFELIATIAHPDPGADDLYRTRVSDEIIGQYLRAARQERALLILDILPGRAEFIDEVHHYEKWLKEPDVSLALDPEWSMGPGQVPNLVIGSTTATKVNEVSAYLEQLVRSNNLPQKLLLVHEFTQNMVRNQSALVARPGIALVLNIDGVGSPEAKVGKYEDLTADPERPTSVFEGFKLFYQEDVNKGGRLMTPYEVLGLDPQPDVVVYE